jgi:hypothetical protein
VETAREPPGDRIHLTAEGHRRTALAAAAALGVPVAGDDTDWRTPLEPAPPQPAREVVAQELAWVRGFVVPWIGRRIRGQSSGDGRAAKRPQPKRLDAILSPVTDL